MGNFEPVAHLAPPYGLVVEVDGDTGDIVSSLHSTNGAVRFISEAYVHDRWSARNMKNIITITVKLFADGSTSVRLTTITWRGSQRG